MKWNTKLVSNLLGSRAESPYRRLLFFYTGGQVWVVYWTFKDPQSRVIYCGAILNCKYWRVLQIAAEYGFISAHDVAVAMLKKRQPD